MSNLVFPTLPGLVFPVKKTPIWSTHIDQTVGGLETRISYWSYPIWEYGIGFELLRDNALNELWQLVGFFNRHRGSFEDWLFQDPDDYQVTNEVFGEGDGITENFQLTRTKGFYTEPVFAPVNYPDIRLDGTLLTRGVHWNMGQRGVINFVDPPGDNDVLTWTGQFYWRCRFNEDEMSVEKFVNKIWQAEEVTFRSVKQ